METVDIEKLKTKTGHQLLNYMNKRGVSSFPSELQRYYYFRNDYLAHEYSIKRKLKRLEMKVINANDSMTRAAARNDYNKIQEDLKWIMEGFFDLSEDEQMNPPVREFFKSEFLDR